MIIFGQRSVQIGDISKKISDRAAIREARILIFQKYAHIFWIPFFPMGRNFTIYFPDTGEAYTQTLFNKMPAPYAEACREVSRETRTPWWVYIGIILIVGAILLAGLFSKK